MHYAYLDWFWPTGLAATIATLAIFGLVQKRIALRRLASYPSLQPLLLVSRFMQGFKFALVLLAAALLGYTVLGPQWGHSDEVTPPLKGRDVFLLLDVSRSMLAEDVAPNRLERAKKELRELLAMLEQRGGYRVALIAFADRASQLCPLTTDYRALRNEIDHVTLESLRLRGDAAGMDGTEIGAALRRAKAALDPECGKCTDLILISDGGDMEADTLSAAEELAQANVTVHAIGLGDADRGSPIPVALPNGGRTLLRYRGEIVSTKLDESLLRQISERTHGEYFAARTGSLSLTPLLNAVAAHRDTRELAEERSLRWKHRYQWFLAPAIGLLLVEMVLRDTRRRQKQAPPKQQPFSWVRRESSAHEKQPVAA
jgi:Ca-activated chloride channel family protein